MVKNWVTNLRKSLGRKTDLLLIVIHVWNLKISKPNQNTWFSGCRFYPSSTFQGIGLNGFLNDLFAFFSSTEF